MTFYPTTGKEISKTTNPITIEAIGYFQERVMHTAKAKVDQQVWPGYETINSLANITLTESSTKLFEFTKKQVREKIEETIKEMAEAQVAEIERIKNEPVTDENVQKRYAQADDIEEFGRLLKYYALYNPTFVIKAIDLVGYGDDDNLTRAIMGYLNDDEIQQLSPELDTKFYDSMATGVTTDEEHELMKKLKKGRGMQESGVKNSFQEEAQQDLNTVRKIVTYQLQACVGGKEKSEAVNNKEDIKQSAKRLKDKGYDITKASIEEGEWDVTFKDSIGKFQKNNGLLNKEGDPDYVIDPGFGTYKKLFGYKQYASGLEQIYANRQTINKKLKTKFSSDLAGDVGNDLEQNKAENKETDIKLVAKRLKNYGIEGVPTDALDGGKYSKAFVEAIRRFQKKSWPNIENPDGNITKGGSTDKKLADFKIFQVDRIYRKDDTKYSEGEPDKEYFQKMEFLQKSMGIKENSETDKILDIAQKAVKNEPYFKAITSGVSSKMQIEPYQISDGSTKLSSVLQSRMERFHKFLVAVGLYQGDMFVTSAIRSKEKAHKFAVQYQIIIGNYESIIKKNLMEMARKNKSKTAKGKYDEIWAKKEHFIFNKKGEVTGIKYDEVQKFVKSKNIGRPNKTDPAAAGHSTSPECLPLPEGLYVSNHTKGLAMDINQKNFINQKDAIIDLIGLLFGVVRAGGWQETWHFELSDLGISTEEMKLIKSEKR